jgi:serine/threonine protein kinase
VITPPVLPAGSVPVPGYEVLGHLHRSRAFDVYDAWSDERHARAVLKTLRPDRLDDATARRRLEAEGRLLRRASHPHIVRGYELDAGPPPVVVTETLRGQTLSHLIDASGPLAPAEAAILGLQVCSALAYLHGLGYLHLDLKPSNVVVDAGRAVLIDLSIARRPGRVPAGLGTWCYLAPEQARGGVVGPPADVWGLGALLFESLTGEVPFGGGEDDEDVPEYPQLVGRTPRLEGRRGVPRGLARLVAASLDHDPARRPALDDVAAALERVRGAGSPRKATP